jgi:hypothetical protein
VVPGQALQGLPQGNYYTNHSCLNANLSWWSMLV